MASDLTFGVEYELKLRLTKKQLQEQLLSDAATKQLEIITNPGPVRLSKVGPQYLRNDYVNFAFRGPSSEYPERTTLVNKITGKESAFRAYSDEVLKIIQKRLRNNPGYENTQIYQGTGKKQTDFSSARLHLTTDASLNGVSRSVKLSERLCSEEEVDETDFVGAEIVTAPHTSPLQARNEANTISTSLSSDGYNYYIDDECAMHVHVGKSDGKPFDIKTLQHLAYLTLVYEHEIAQMSIPRKRGSDFETISNRIDFASECPPTTDTHVYLCDHMGHITENSINIVWNYQSLSTIRKAIFDKVDQAEDPMRAFVNLMGTTKGRIVNFSYCARDNTNNEPAATVEFRQHQGSLNGDDVFHWARHCTALVSLAERYAQTNTCCPVTQWEDTISLEHLWREMKLPESTKHFYRQRVQEYAQRWPEEHPVPLFEPPLFFDDDEFDNLSEGSEGSEPSMTEVEVSSKC